MVSEPARRTGHQSPSGQAAARYLTGRASPPGQPDDLGATLAPPINIMEANPLYYNSNADVAGQIEGANGPIGVTMASGNHSSVLVTGIDYGYGADLWTGTHQTATLTDPGGDNTQAPQLALSPDGTMLAVVDLNGRTYLWHAG